MTTMNEEKLFDLLKNSSIGSSLGAIKKTLKSKSTPPPSRRCVKLLFTRIIERVEEEDMIAASTLTGLLHASLSHDNYKIVNKEIISSLVALHPYFMKIKRMCQFLHKTFTYYLNTIMGLLDNSKVERDAAMQFAPVLFIISLEENYSYDLRMEAAGRVNGILWGEHGEKTHARLITLSGVKQRWLDMGEAIESAGDYELQNELLELLFRMFRPEKRKMYAERLFPEKPEIQKLLLSVRDDGFDSESRSFLNALNSEAPNRKVYSYTCSRVSTIDVDIPISQGWLDVNFGSSSITAFINTPSEDGTPEITTLIIKNDFVLKHDLIVKGPDCHVILTLKDPVSSLLGEWCKTNSHKFHFVLDSTPDPRGPIMGLLGQHLPSSPKLGKQFRVDVSEEAIQICGKKTRIVSTPVSTDRNKRLTETRKLLVEKIPDSEPLPQLELGLSQPDKKKIKAFIATDPIVANPRAPQCSPSEDCVIPDTQPTAIPDSLPNSAFFESGNPSSPVAAAVYSSPVAAAVYCEPLPVIAIPDSQNKGGRSCGARAVDDSNWTVQSSFDFSVRMDDSEISAVGDDTIADLMKETVAEIPEDDYLIPSGQLDDPVIIEKPKSRPKSSKKGKERAKKPLEFEKPAKGEIIKVGAINGSSQQIKHDSEKIVISNKRSRNSSKKSDNTQKETKEVEITRVVDVEFEEVINLDEEPIKKDLAKSPPVKRKEDSAASSAVSCSNENSPISLNQQLDEINCEIVADIPSSPGDVYRQILQDGIHISSPLAKKVLQEGTSNSPKPSTSRQFKRKLMDTEDRFLCSPINSQDLPMSLTPLSQKKAPAFARKRISSGPMNLSSNFVVSKNRSLQSLKKPVKEDIPDEIIPEPPAARKSILKKKFLDKTKPVAPKTPELGAFKFDENSDASWVKTEKKQKRRAGFKTKKQKQEEEKAVRRKQKEERDKEREKDKQTKKLTKKKETVSVRGTVVRGTVESSQSSNPEDIESVQKTKLEARVRSPTPSPPPKTTRYSMRRKTVTKKVNYREPVSGDEAVSVSASEYSTTTQSTVHGKKPICTVEPNNQKREESIDPGPLEMIAAIDQEIADNDHQESQEITSDKQEGSQKSLEESYLDKRNRQSKEAIAAIEQEIAEVLAMKPSPEQDSQERSSCTSSSEESSQKSLEEKYLHKKNRRSQEVIDAFDDIFSQVKTTNLEKIEVSGNNTMDAIAKISAQFDDACDDQLTASQEELLAPSQEEITRIPSSETVGIPLSYKTDVSSLPSMAFACTSSPSPVIRTSFKKIPEEHKRSIRMKLSPEIRNISPAVCSQNGSPDQTPSSSSQDLDVVRETQESGCESEFSDPGLRKSFEQEMMQAEDKKIEKEEAQVQKRALRCYQRNSSKSKRNSSRQEFEELDKLQESFNIIDKNTTFEVVETKLSQVQRTVIEEEIHNSGKSKKLWNDGEALSTARRVISKPKAFFQEENISSKLPVAMTDNDMSVQFNEVSACMVTEADSSGLLMEIEEFQTTPVSEEIKQKEVQNLFSSILEESRLAGMNSEPDSAAKYISTPTKLSHIREADEANVSPFQQFLEQVGDIRSPIREARGDKRKKQFLEQVGDIRSHIRESRGDKRKKEHLRMSLYDSGLGSLQVSANMSLEKTLKRPQVRSPTFMVKSPAPKLAAKSPALTRAGISSQSPGRQQLEDYYEMLCKTPGKLASSIGCSQGSGLVSQGSGFVSQPVLPDIPTLNLSPLELPTSPVRITSRESPKDETGSTQDCPSESSSFLMPPYMLESENGLSLQMLQNQARKMKEKQKLRAKESIDLITTDLKSYSQRFFETNRKKRRTLLNEMAETVTRNVESIETELVDIKRKEGAALRSLAHAHKIQRDSRVSLETKMQLLKQKTRYCDHEETTREEEREGLRELRVALQRQICERQKLLDKNQIQKQRKHLMKQMAMILMTDMD